MSLQPPARIPYVLGLDIGANSIGWAAVAVDRDGEPLGFISSAKEMQTRPSVGVRIFDEGVENYGKGEREVGRGQKRRMARLQRRQTMRRARRMAKTFRVLQELGLLPPFADGQLQAEGPAAARDRLIKRLDKSLSKDLARNDRAKARIAAELLPYVLRTQALDIPLSTHEFGRALYHLSQRRGFQSNRKSSKKDEDEGTVKSGISELSRAMSERGSRTLGEHLLLEAHEGRRIRERWTARSMYCDEFERIWETQARHHPQVLTVEAKKRLHRTIFFQRPLKSQRNLIGACELENGDEYVHPETGAIHSTRRRRRAPESFLVSQRFRVLQTVNNLAVVGIAGASSTTVSNEQKQRLMRELEEVEHLTFAKVATLLGLPRGTRFNLQAGGEKTLKGNRTNAQMLDLFGDRWRTLDPTSKNRAILELWGAPNDAVLVRRAKAKQGPWSILRPTSDEAEALPSLKLSGDYVSLSTHAMEALSAVMVDGVPYMTAVRQVYGERVRHEVLDQLPPVDKALGSLRNPGVTRALTELRRVVNHLIKLYGRPEEIRVELARDLKKSKDERNRIIKANREREREREQAAERAIREGGLQHARPGDILKVQLAQECGWVCPYSGDSFSMKQLLGGDIDVEHIIPYSLCLDDSYMNKTLCLARVNRGEKSNRSPYEAFGHDDERWGEMIARMERNVGEHGMPKAKLERFQLSGEAYKAAIEQFKSSQLNDTRYASRAAKEYVASLFGGNVSQGTDEHLRKRVLVGNGQATALVRRQLGMESVLRRAKNWPAPPNGDWNKRADHRHHGMDAVAIALTGPGMIQRLSRAAEKGWQDNRRAFGRIPEPWDGFQDDLQARLDEVVVSFRVDNRARGALHKETIYSPRRAEEGRRDAEGGFTHVRVRIESMESKEFPSIVDDRVRGFVEQHFAGREPAKVCKRDDPATFPSMPTKDGRKIPIRRVRVRKHNTTFSVGRGPRAREVENDTNHHLILRDMVDERGRRKLTFELISLSEACRRRAIREPVIRRDTGVLFTLAGNDLLRLAEQGQGDRYFRVRTLTAGKIEGCWHSDARQKNEVKKAGDWITLVASRLAPERGSRKVTVTPIGVVRPCRA